MAAPKRVDWTFEALEELANIHDAVQQRWSPDMAERFLGLVSQFEDLVAKYPNGFRASTTNPSLRLGIIHRTVLAVYRVDPDRVLVISLIHARADNSRFL
ncbi:MAG TPA: type II toxin-antitoxin system RelE/ParE family toxin [Flavobacteriales bacterium]|nr:type II toxin-antitoxin system RelE/ParE family toxin [Flavobacteriales bacterium]HRN38102.1 type II toxin-antitoxin system RelE/ParE family toxin [Flavobacteriales bacterium]HRO40011.1 type II toxin-antitoxin system RelE/ParE family toxin [Flavobacteriales bacterium]HRP80950.1 type II toxin-antitoxin system RelE/ParE family toxin [Flavobacteriales bacterium]HRQ84675.1 type II toxin-antitoxin system RelE/ParE family toxin [Flavobacteriales bacterium]